MVYKAPYETIETELTNNFSIRSMTSNGTPATPTTNKRENYSKPEYKHLDSYIMYKPYNPKPYNSKPRYIASIHIPGKKLVAEISYNTCNIFCEGYEGVIFNIEKLTKDTTRVEINYYDNVTSFFIFPYITIGAEEEKYIHKFMFNHYEVIQQ